MGKRRHLSAPAPPSAPAAAQGRPRRVAGRGCGRRPGGRRGDDPEGRQRACSPVPRTLGTHRRHLLPGVHRSGRNDDSPAPGSGRWQMRAQSGGAGDRLRTRSLRRPPARRAGARRRGRSPRQGCSRSGITRGSTQPPRPKLLPDTRSASLGRLHAPASQSLQVPARRVWAGRQDPRGPHLRGHKAQESPHPAVPSLPQCSPQRPERRGARPRTPRSAGVSTSEQSPRPAVLAGTCTRTRPSAPAWPRRSPPGSCAPRRPAPARAPPNPPRRVSRKPNVRLSSPSRPHSTERDGEVGLPGPRGAWTRRHKLVPAGRR